MSFGNQLSAKRVGKQLGRPCVRHYSGCGYVRSGWVWLCERAARRRAKALSCIVISSQIDCSLPLKLAWVCPSSSPPYSYGRSVRVSALVTNPNTFFTSFSLFDGASLRSICLEEIAATPTWPSVHPRRDAVLGKGEQNSMLQPLQLPTGALRSRMCTTAS